MIWVCRPGKHGDDFNQVHQYGDIFLAWDGYHLDLHAFSTREQFKKLVIKEKNPSTRSTVSNWAGQLYSFCCEMKKGDYVLVPNHNAKEFLFAQITGGYRYEPTRQYPHVRKIDVVVEKIPRSLFSQPTQYSLGAYRTIFKVKQEEEILRIMKVESLKKRV